MTKKIVSIMLIVILILGFSCKSDPYRKYEKVLNKYIKYMGNEDFEKIQDELLAPRAKDIFVGYLANMSKSTVTYNGTIDNFNNLKKAKVIELEEYKNGEASTKFQFINKEGIATEQTWFRFSISEDGDVKIMKFQKH